MKKKAEIKYDSNAIIGYLLLGLSFSWLSPLVLFPLFGFNIVEIFLIPSFFFLIRSKQGLRGPFIKTFKSKRFLIALFIIFIATVLGLLSPLNSMTNIVLADFRVHLIFVFLLFLLTRPTIWEEDNRRKFILTLLILVSLMDVLALFLRPYIQIEMTTKQTISIIAPAILAVYYLRSKRHILAVFFLAILSYEAITGFFRNYYIIASVVYLICFVYLVSSLLTNKKKTVKLYSALILLFTITVAIYITPIVYDYWTSDESKMIHSIDRSSQFAEEAGAGETERIGSVSVVLLRPDLFILPRGIGARNYTAAIEREFEDFTIISSYDSCFFYLAYHYGLVVLFLFFFYVGKQLFSMLRNSQKLYSNTIFSRYIGILFLLLFFISFFVQGSMFVSLQGAFSYSVLYSLVVRPI